MPGQSAPARRWSTCAFDSDNSVMKKLSQLIICSSLMLGLPAASLLAEEAAFDGLDLNLGNLYRVAPAQSRSISPENFTGEKGKAGMATEGTGKNCAREL